MRVAALCDIHGNLPALEAVLREIRQEGIDQIVVGGDVVPGPMPRETIARLLEIDVPVRYVYGNGELGVLAQMAATDPESVTYWGTASGKPLPEPLREIPRWSARQLTAEDKAFLASWPMTVRLEIDGLGQVLFCHSTPRSETEIFTRETAEEKLLPIFAGVGAAAVVCGHMHTQFDRRIGSVRVVNAGSVGMPFEQPAGAYWLRLGPDVQLRRTSYDFANAAELVRGTTFPLVEDLVVRYILQPPTEAETIALYTPHELR